MNIQPAIDAIPSRRIVIGDVHGHYDTLLRLFDAIAPNERDGVYFIGDLIDRGPNSSQVVDFVIKNKYHCLLGNHEQMLLDAVGRGGVSQQLLQSWLYTGGLATLESYHHHIPQEHIDWMQGLPLYLDLGDVWLVHAGVDPKLPLAEQTAEQCCWIRDEFHQIYRPYFADKLIIIGHTITFTFPGIQPGKLACGPGWLDIDTGAYHPKSGWLTGFDVTNRLVYQVQTSSKSVRKIPLDDAVTFVDPAMVAGKRPKKRGLFG